MGRVMIMLARLYLNTNIILIFSNFTNIVMREDQYDHVRTSLKVNLNTEIIKCICISGHIYR